MKYCLLSLLFIAGLFYRLPAQVPQPWAETDAAIEFVLQNSGWVAGMMQDITDGVPGGLGEDVRTAAGEMGGAAATAAGHMRDLQDRLQDAAELYNAMQVLDQNECTPDFSQDASALMPSSCTGDQGCTDCYGEALEKLDANRRGLARMLCIYNNTKTFKDRAITFGNNLSSIGGGVGFGWQKAKRDIEMSYENFKQSYDRKYADFMTALQRSLAMVSECEARYGIRDWYQKFGFMYFEFLQQKYKRTD
jgi:hypothetical protein